MTSAYRLFVPAISIIHGLFTLYLFVTMFSGFDGWTMYHARPFYMLAYTLTWVLIQFKKKWAVILYFLLTFFDAACKYVYGNTWWGEALEETLFPLSILFLMVCVLIYKSHFDGSTETK